MPDVLLLGDELYDHRRETRVLPEDLETNLAATRRFHRN